MEPNLQSGAVESCASAKGKEEREKKIEEKTSVSGTIDPQARFQLINVKKDEGNFLFREKQYAAALDRYVESLVELKAYRRHWQLSRLRRLSIIATTNETGTSSSASAAPDKGHVLGKRSCDKDTELQNKGKEKMDVEVLYPVQSKAEAGLRDSMPIRGAVQDARPRPLCDEEAEPTGDDDGLQRKRRRIDEESCTSEKASDDMMTVEIIDKSVYAMPKDMGCQRTASSSSPSPATSTTTSPTSSATEMVPGWDKTRSFKQLTECEKNLMRLEVIIRLNIAACAIRLGRGVQALAQARKVLSTGDLDLCEPLLYAKGLFRKAQSLKLMGHNQDACSNLRLASAFSPTDRAIRNELAALEEKEKEASFLCKFIEKLKCKRPCASETQQQTQSPPKSSKCTFFSGLFGGNCAAKSTFSLLCRRETAGRLTQREMATAGYQHLPKEKAITVDRYHRRAYSGQWSNDGDLLFTTCQDWKIRIYANDSKTLSRKCIINAKKGQWTITDAVMSSNNSYLLYSSITPYVHLVPLPRNLIEMEAKGNHSVLNFVGAQGSDYSGIWCMALSADDREVLAGTSDSSVCVYDLEKSHLVERAAAHADDVNSVCYVETYNEDGSSTPLIASASDDGLIFLWDKRCMTDPVGTLFGHTEGLTCISSKGDGRYLLSNSKDQTMKLWDLRKMVDRSCAQPPQRKYVWDYRGMSYPGDPSVDRHPCDLSVSTFRGHSVLRTLVRCNFSPPAWSGQRYVSAASSDGKVYIYDLTSTLPVRVYDPCTEREGNCAVVRDISWHPYLPHLVATAWNGSVSLFSHEDKSALGEEERNK